MSHAECVPNGNSVNYGVRILTKQAYSIAEVKAELGIGQTKLYALIKEGKIKTHKIGARTIIKAESLKNFLDSLPEVAA
jgi:excisionase family DNA binding protein